MKTRAIYLALLLIAACGQSTTTKAPEPAPHELNPQDLHIEIGRYGVMLSHVTNLTHEMAPAANVPSDPATPVALARQLRETVWEYNLERSRLCSDGLYTAVSCGPVFNPVWLADAADAEPTLQELKQRADAVGAEVMPFWNAVCEDVRAHETDDQAKMTVCAIE